MERTLDAIARELGLERAEVRRRNLLQPGDFPHEVGPEDCRREAQEIADSTQLAPKAKRAILEGNARRFMSSLRTALVIPSLSAPSGFRTPPWWMNRYCDAPGASRGR